jgi:hypothetical protein
MRYGVMHTSSGEITQASKRRDLASNRFGIHVPPGTDTDLDGNHVLIQQIEGTISRARPVSPASTSNNNCLTLETGLLTL